VPAFVGTGIAGALAGSRVFVMHPHQGIAEVEDAHAFVLPDEVPSERATLIPNLETALNATWDAELGEGDRCLVLGAGPIGLLVGYVLRRLALMRDGVGLVEADGARAALARGLPWVGEVMSPRNVGRGGCDVAFHCTGTPEGLQSAIDAVGFEGRVIDLSWYGNRPVTLRLGTDFHHGRKRIFASQVGAVAPSRRGEIGPHERVAEVISLLSDPELDRLLGPPIPFGDMPAFMRDLYRGKPIPPLPVVAYGDYARE
jgi:threonine dehydrogenase-like Zn-dependent dehydrogenase